MTSGEFSTDFGGFSRDGKKLLFTRTLIDMTERPYSKTELYSLDLSTLKEELLWKGAWFNGAQWSPDGKNLLILGGPSAFGAIGQNLPKGRTPNDYDIQAYLYNPDPQTGRIDHPGVQSLHQPGFLGGERRSHPLSDDRSVKNVSL